MGGACGTHMREREREREREEVHTGLWWGNLRKTNHLENIGVDGRIMLISIVKKSVRRG